VKKLSLLIMLIVLIAVGVNATSVMYEQKYSTRDPLQQFQNRITVKNNSGHPLAANQVVIWDTTTGDLTGVTDTADSEMGFMFAGFVVDGVDTGRYCDIQVSGYADAGFDTGVGVDSTIVGSYVVLSNDAAGSVAVVTRAPTATLWKIGYVVGITVEAVTANSGGGTGRIKILTH